MFEAELYRLKARALLVCGAPDTGMEAQSLLEEALNTARRQDVKALELRVAKDLAALWNDQGRREDALNLLKPVYDWFNEGFDTRDLKEAKALLDQLR
jgi:predicted ATPase